MKGLRITRGDLALLSKERPCKPACWRSSGGEKSAEGIVKSRFDRTEGPNKSSIGKGAFVSMVRKVQPQREEMPESTRPGSGRNPRVMVGRLYGGGGTVEERAMMETAVYGTVRTVV